MNAIAYPRQFMADTGGRPLENGDVYIGEANQDPQTFPIQVFWDAALTIPAMQPLDVSAGYVMNAGERAAFYIAESEFSIRLRDKHGNQVDYIPEVSIGLLGPDGAAYIGFLQAGTGAVSRTVQSKLRDTVSAFDFMTDGQINAVKLRTLTHDVTAAVQAAIDTGNLVYGPSGSYLISSDLEFTNSFSGFYGDGYGTKIVTNNGTADILTIGDGSNEITGLYFAKFRVWSTVVKTAGLAANCRLMTDSTFVDVRLGSIDDHTADGHRLYDGIYFDRFSQNSFLGGEIVVSRKPVQARGNVDQSYGAELTFDDGYRIAKASDFGFRFGGGCGGVRLGHGDVSECGGGWIADKTLTAIYNRELFWSGLTIDNCTGWGVDVADDSLETMTYSSGWVSGCGNNATGAGGIRVQPTTGVSTAWLSPGLRVQSCKYDGAQFSSGNINWVGGICRANGIGANGGHGILLSGTAVRATILGLSIHNNGNGTRGYGFSIGSTADNYTIESNDLFSNGQGPVDQPSGPSATQIIRNNRGYVTESNGTASIPNGASSVVVNHGLSAAPTLVDIAFAGVQDAGAYAYVTPGSTTATQFTITYSTIAGGTRSFWWRATRGVA